MHHFLIVGGGVIGLSLAWELARRGQSVTVVDRGGQGSQASWVGAGIIPPPQSLAVHDPLEQLRARGHALHLEWSQQLLRDTGVDNELRRCGGLHLARSAAEAAALRVGMEQMHSDGVRVESLSRSAVVRCEPQLRDVAPTIQAAFRLPDEMQLRPPRHLRALRSACEQQGVDLRFDRDALAIRRRDSRAEVVVGEQALLADQVCLCGGTWTGKLLETVAVHLPVEPWRGQLLLWKTDQPLLSHVLNEGYRYLVPRLDGHLLAGATVEDVGFACDTTEQATESLRAFARGLLPTLCEADPKQAWAGLRPGTPDGRPYLGRVPGFDNLAVATGHYRSGLHLSAVTAVFMAQLLLDDTPEMDLHPFRIDR